MNPDVLAACVTVWLCWTELMVLLWCLRKSKVKVQKGLKVSVGE